MADITVCDDLECPQRKTCYRYLAPKDVRYQSHFVESPRNKETNECDYYWNIGEPREKKYE